MSRLGKLRAMGAAEILGRGAIRLDRLVERRTLPRYRRQGLERLRRGVRADLATRPDWRHAILAARRETPARFFAPFDDLSATRQCLLADYPDQMAATLARAGRTRAHEFELFGQLAALGARIDWHADPLTGETWPLAFHEDVPFGDPQSRRGDVKHVWELNRHQFLPDLAKASLVSSDPAFAREIHAILDDWIAANPCGVGINWAGPLEVAYRALSWIWTDHIAGADEGTDEFRLAWLASLLDHGRFLHRHLELYASPYNHLIGEAAVLYMMGVLFPEFREAPRWRQRGRRVLEARLASQFYGDGGSVEQAVVYHHATLGFYLLAALLGRRNDEEFAAGVWRAIERAIDFSMRLAHPDGTLPAIGDNDDARPLVFEWRTTWDFRHFHAIGAVLFARRDFKRHAGRFAEEALWVLGIDGRRKFDALGGDEAPPASITLSESGYVVLRGERPADYVCVDAGPQAGGLRTDGVPSAAHGHADALSALVVLGDRPLLVDAGFFSYNGDRAWERYFREARAHNTMTIDGHDQALHLEKMAWAWTPQATIESSSTDRDDSWAVVSHDGFRRLPGAPRHRRTVWLSSPGCVIVYDEIVSQARHRAELVWQFDAGLEATLEPHQVSLRPGFACVWRATADLVPVLRCGGETPDAGWVAPHLGVRRPAPRLSLTTAGAVERLRVLTVFVDRDVWTATVEPPGHAAIASLAIGVSNARGADTIVAAAMPPMGLRTDAALAIWSHDAAQHRITRARRIGGSFMTPEVHGA